MNPFDLNNHEAYLLWRSSKLQWAHEAALLEPVVLPTDYLSRPEIHKALTGRCFKHGFTLYRLEDKASGNKQFVIQLGQLLGLDRLDSNLCADEDSVTAIENRPQGSKQRYIPYTNRPLNWHTDGYYNTDETNIRAFILHCVIDAAEGGGNALFDNELAYITLRDENPAFIQALQHPQAMSIPPNTEGDQEIRDWQAGPVFSVHPETGELHMRYTARKRNVQWRDDELTLEAVTFLHSVLDESDNVIRYRLSPGEGIVSRNSLHRRDGFDNAADQQRLLYRARYYDAVRGSVGELPR